MAYVYRHVRLDTNEVFYVGVGKNDYNGKFTRAYTHRGRSKFWQAIVSKTEYEVEIIMTDLLLEDAYEKEIEFVKFYGRRNLGLGTLVNLTDGGRGNLNVITSKETRVKRGAKMRLFRHTPDSKEKIRQALLGVKHTPERKANQSKFSGNKGKPRTEEVKSKISKANKGKIKSGILLLNLETGIYHDSLREAARAYNISKNTLFSRIKLYKHIGSIVAV